MTRLIECKDCGHEVSKSAEACPNCGKRFNLRWYEARGCFGWALAWLFIGVVLLVVFGSG